MAVVGYARVSSRGQSLEIQKAALTHCDKVFEEKVSGRKQEGREALAKLLDYVREGDVVTVTRLDRLARSSHDLQTIAATLKAKGVDLRVIEQPIDTSTAAGKLFFDMLAAFAEFEATIRAERQREGIDAALAKGDDSPFKGRPAKIKRADVQKAVEDTGSKAAAAKKLGISRDSVYRVLDGR